MGVCVGRFLKSVTQLSATCSAYCSCGWEGICYCHLVVAAGQTSSCSFIQKNNVGDQNVKNQINFNFFLIYSFCWNPEKCCFKYKKMRKKKQTKKIFSNSVTTAAKGRQKTIVQSSKYEACEGQRLIVSVWAPDLRVWSCFHSREDFLSVFS